MSETLSIHIKNSVCHIQNLILFHPGLDTGSVGVLELNSTKTGIEW